MQIDFEGHILHSRAYRMSSSELKELKVQLKDYLERGWIIPSTSEFALGVLFAIKPCTNKLRMCTDFRRLNTYKQTWFCTPKHRQYIRQTWLLKMLHRSWFTKWFPSTSHQRLSRWSSYLSGRRSYSWIWYTQNCLLYSIWHVRICRYATWPCRCSKHLSKICLIYLGTNQTTLVTSLHRWYINILKQSGWASRTHQRSHGNTRKK